MFWIVVLHYIACTIHLVPHSPFPQTDQLQPASIHGGSYASDPVLMSSRE